MSSALRDALRQKVFSAKRSSKLVPIGTAVEGEEQVFIEVMAPLVGDMLEAQGTDDSKHRMCRMMIMTCFVPGTSEPVFEEADFDSLMAIPANKDYSALMAAMTQNIEAKALEADAKK